MTTPAIPAPQPPRPAALLDPVIHRRRGVLWKITGIGLLILLLHIPLLMTEGVLRERQAFQAQATEEIARVWGQEQTLAGPVLVVPYTYTAPIVRQRSVGGQVISVQEDEAVTAQAYFLPEELTVEGSVDPEIRHRGIYDTVVYTSQLVVAGRFRPEPDQLNLDARQMRWGEARVLFGVSDLRGLRSLSPWRQPDGTGADFEPLDAAGQGLPLVARAGGIAPGTEVAFRLEIALQGSDRVAFVPAGKRTQVSLRSPWADPSFSGAWLPAVREVSPAGFSARWESTHFTRGFPQAWTDRETEVGAVVGRMHGDSFGVEFRQAVEGYRLVERARKYGVLFFVLVFAVFFLFESMAGLRIHPLQYLLVGAALCLFFLGFLALSEVIPVAWAYGGAAAACTAMIALYAWTFLRTGWRAALIGTGLGITYAYLYFVLQSQDYALLAGTAALFAGLGAIMYCTRRMNWYAVDLEAHSARTSPPPLPQEAQA